MVLDTSGSMNDGMLAQSLAEVGGVLRSLGVAGRQLDIICCDAEAFEAQKVCGPTTEAPRRGRDRHGGGAGQRPSSGPSPTSSWC